MTDWKEIESRVFMTTGRRMPVVVERGEGTRVWDDNGKPYLDFFGGPAVHSLGHCHPVVVKAIEEQARTLIHVSNAVYSMPQLKLAQLLIDNSCFDRVYFRQQRRRGQRGGDQAGAQVGPRAQERRLRDHRGDRRVPRPHARGGDGDGHAALQRAVRAAAGRLPPRPVQRHRGAAERRRRRRPARSCSSRSRARAASTCPNPSYFPAVRKWCDEQQHPADRRRGADGHVPHRPAVRLPGDGLRAGRDDAGQGHRLRRAARRRSWRRRAAAVFTPGRPRLDRTAATRWRRPSGWR